MKHSFATARLTRSRDSNADFEVLFSSPPSHADVELIEHDDTLTLGLKWENAGPTKPVPGQELDHDQLREALKDKTEFTQQEWNGFGITNLRKDHFVKRGANYFKPAKSLVARRVRNVTTTITANDDWPEYKELMIQACYRGIVQEMPINQNHVRYSESGLKLFNATVRSNIAIRDRGSCTITRYVKVSLSRFAISEKYHLLAGFEVKHFFEANPLHMQSSMKPDQFQNV